MAAGMTIALRRPLFALATSDRFERAVRRAQAGEALAYRLATRYVAGRTAEDAFATARRLAERGVLSSIDLFGERVSDPSEADRVTDEYVALAGRIAEAAPGAYLSVDLSHLAIDEPGSAARGRLERIAAALPPGVFVEVGAEDAARTDQILETVLAVARAGGRVAATVQANLRRSAVGARRLGAGRCGRADPAGQGRLRRVAGGGVPVRGADRSCVREAGPRPAPGRRHRVVGDPRSGAPR